MLSFGVYGLGFSVKEKALLHLFEIEIVFFFMFFFQLYEVVRREIWYRPDMFFYRDMLMMLARNRRVDETNKVWGDLKREGVLF